jgi:NDP-sugar pyrophosphorylase family protein
MPDLTGPLVPGPRRVPARAVTQAVILAGGRGSRLRPFTDDRPKPMVEIPGTGRPILDHQLRWLAAAGVRDVVISCGHLAHVIETWVAGADLPVRVRTVVEEEPLGRGGGLRFAGAALPDRDRPWLALNGDIVTDFPLLELAGRHQEEAATATLTLVVPELPWGVVHTEAASGHRVTRFQESPLSPWPVNAGVYLFSPEMHALLPEKGDHERTTFPALAARGGLAAYRLPAHRIWRAVDTAKDLEVAARLLTAAPGHADRPLRDSHA